MNADEKKPFIFYNPDADIRKQRNLRPGWKYSSISLTYGQFYGFQIWWAISIVLYLGGFAGATYIFFSNPSCHVRIALVHCNARDDGSGQFFPATCWSLEETRSPWYAYFATTTPLIFLPMYLGGATWIWSVLAGSVTEEEDSDEDPWVDEDAEPNNIIQSISLGFTYAILWAYVFNISGLVEIGALILVGVLGFSWKITQPIYFSKGKGDGGLYTASLVPILATAAVLLYLIIHHMSDDQQSWPTEFLIPVWFVFGAALIDLGVYSFMFWKKRISIFVILVWNEIQQFVLILMLLITVGIHSKCH